MIKKLLIINILFLIIHYSMMALATEYKPSQALIGTIHTIKLTKGYCSYLEVSTKVGNLVNRVCQYEKETPPYAYDTCTLKLNAGVLEVNAGKGYQCAATHIRSNVTGDEKLDEFKLIVNNDGHYIGSQPAYSEIELTGPNTQSRHIYS
jgi:hypothetical protein